MIPDRRLFMLFSNTISYYYPPDVLAFYEFQNDFRTLMEKRRKKTQPLVIVCIGTDRATGDCLGPLVGQYLQNHCLSSTDCTIYECLSNPVHAQNLHETIKKIETSHEQPFIIAIDACLGCREHVGYITLSPLPLFPGQGVSKDLPPIGNISITGIVNHTSYSNEEMIQNTRLQIVVELASFISSGIEHLCCPY